MPKGPLETLSIVSHNTCTNGACLMRRDGETREGKRATEICQGTIKHAKQKRAREMKNAGKGNREYRIGARQSDRLQVVSVIISGWRRCEGLKRLPANHHQLCRCRMHTQFRTFRIPVTTRPEAFAASVQLPQATVTHGSISDEVTCGFTEYRVIRRFHLAFAVDTVRCPPQRPSRRSATLRLGKHAIDVVRLQIGGAEGGGDGTDKGSRGKGTAKA
ncbi:uncharacterized protein SPSK_10714 [Sporothrix schenckii 1099-18]|uniref:Uncharacterized protein n=1 Tax=Sporothrix schenckii 1099-18 TaxID=1397361 RepID=A0A0F2MK98_SPOSC|nr:uncharacterized protein SPSK_10714 [Sporothrix schenckii 1099-18]KJR89265.1 hypothetical protein SPSK_10714 [Sporothrix schenckii 1099-18]